MIYRLLTRWRCHSRNRISSRGAELQEDGEFGDVVFEGPPGMLGVTYRSGSPDRSKGWLALEA